MTPRNEDDWTVERWRTEPRWHPLENVEEPQLVDTAPPLWKDVTVAAIAALLLWGAVVALFG